MLKTFLGNGKDVNTDELAHAFRNLTFEGTGPLRANITTFYTESWEAKSGVWQ